MGATQRIHVKRSATRWKTSGRPYSWFLPAHAPCGFLGFKRFRYEDPLRRTIAGSQFKVGDTIIELHENNSPRNGLSTLFLETHR